MIRLFLVEDEIAMREGIKKNIPWEELGIEFCGEAGDGELAWPAIREERPDIVITDIRMPFMDGLQLSRLICRELPETKIVILSGYGEFQYAQEALRMGVAEYLLKPITPKKLQEVLGVLVAQVEEEKRARAAQTDWQAEEQRERERANRKVFFRALISGGMNSHDILEKADTLGFQLSAPFYRFLILHALTEEGSDSAQAEALMEAMEEETEGRLVYVHSLDSAAALLTGRSPEEIEERTCALQEQMAAFCGTREDLHYFISAGEIVSHLSQIHRVYHAVSRAAAYRFFLEPDRLVTADMSLGRLVSEENRTPINTEKALQNGNLSSIWTSFLHTGTLQEAPDFVEATFSSVGEENTSSILFLNYLTMDCYFTMARFLKELGREPEEVNEKAGDINTVLGTLRTAEDARAYLTAYLEEVLRQRDSSTSRHNNQLMQNVLSYIEAHYTEGTLSLQSVAEVAGLSPNRFSTLFSHEMGIPFIEYLIRMRMKRACELLMTTDMKAFEVADSAGYNDPHYFSATFKKMMGMSPMEYRKRGQE